MGVQKKQEFRITGICIVHLTTLHCIIFHLLFFWFMIEKNSLMSFCSQLICTIVEGSVIHLHRWSASYLCVIIHFTSTLQILSQVLVFLSDKRCVLAECVWSTCNPFQMLPRKFSLAGIITTLLFDLITPQKLFLLWTGCSPSDNIEAEECRSCSRLGQLPELEYYCGSQQLWKECSINLHSAV